MPVQEAFNFVQGRVLKVLELLLHTTDIDRRLYAHNDNCMFHYFLYLGKILPRMELTKNKVMASKGTTD